MDRDALVVNFLENTKDESMMLRLSCSEELEETVEDDKLYCIKCQKTVSIKNTQPLQNNTIQKSIKSQE